MAKKSADQAEVERRRMVEITDPETHRKIRMLAASMDVSVPDWINNTLQPIVEVQYQELMRNAGGGAKK